MGLQSLRFDSVVVAILCVGCGGHAPASLSGGSGGSSTGDEGDGSADASSSGNAPLALGDAGPVFMSLSDGASAASVNINCEPGTYSGPFTTTVTSTSDAGGLLGLLGSLFKYPWMGTLSITLQAMTQAAGTGENTYTTLVIAPGAKMSGVDQTGGHFTADISGTLDCTTEMLTGMLSNGTYEYPDDAGSITMNGTLSATYAVEAGVPALSGAITASSPTYQGIGAAGTWSASLQ